MNSFNCLLILFCFVLSTSCKRLYKSTNPQDEFVTHCGYIKCALILYTKEKNIHPKTKSEIDEAMIGWNQVDAYGKKYDISYVDQDTYVIRASGKDGIVNTSDDKVRNIQVNIGSNQ